MTEKKDKKTEIHIHIHGDYVAGDKIVISDSVIYRSQIGGSKEGKVEAIVHHEPKEDPIALDIVIDATKKGIEAFEKFDKTMKKVGEISRETVKRFEEERAKYPEVTVSEPQKVEVRTKSGEHITAFIDKSWDQYDADPIGDIRKLVMELDGKTQSDPRSLWLRPENYRELVDYLESADHTWMSNPLESGVPTRIDGIDIFQYEEPQFRRGFLDEPIHQPSAMMGTSPAQVMWKPFASILPSPKFIGLKRDLDDK